MKARPRRLLVVASHGGHWTQMRRLSPAFEGFAVHYVSTTPSVAGEVAPAPLMVVKDANLQDTVALVPLAWKMLTIVAATQPDIVLSTGAAPGFFALAFGKLFGAKTVWIDSLANAEQMSVSGKYVRRFADLWLTQWPDLGKPGGPLYKGSVL